MPLQQTTFENIVTNGEISQTSNLSVCPNAFNYSEGDISRLMLLTLFKETFSVFANTFSLSSAADVLCAGNGLSRHVEIITDS